MGVTYTLPSATPADIWTYSVRGLSKATMLTIGAPVVVAAGAGAKGAYTEIVAALGAAVDGIMVRIRYSPTATNANFLVDIAVGAAGAEVVVATNIKGNALWDGTTNAFENDFQIVIPNVKMAAGQRVAARALSSGAGVNITVEVCG